MLAAGLTVGAVIDARHAVPDAFDVATVLSCVVCAGSVAWRRFRPALACVAACSGYVALAVISGYDSAGVFEWLPVGLTFYTLGRWGVRSDVTPVVLGLFAGWLLGAVLIYYVPTSGSVAGVLALWASAIVPFAVGRVFAARSALIGELTTRAAQLEREQDLGARRAVVEERSRIARELHDIVAHCVSVMVVQTVGARTVAQQDLALARGALKVVESNRREALVELRRTVGVLRRDGDPLAGSAAPGLSELGALVDRARAAGVPVELHVVGRRTELPAAIELVAYRVIQEALTNVIKHAGDATARVTVSYGDGELVLEVSDTGSTSAAGPAEIGSGHGMPGMRERVRLCGGELRAGPRLGGGFEVRARIPLDETLAPVVTPRPHEPDRYVVAPLDRLRWPWLDPLLAAVALVVLELEVLGAHPRRGPLALAIIVVAGIPLATVWRRRFPVWFAVAVTVFWVTATQLALPKHAGITLSIWAFVLYTLAAWTQRRTAVLWLAGAVGLFTLEQALGRNNASAVLYAGLAFLLCAAWGCGRMIRARRSMIRQLQQLSARLAAEREDRARLAVAGERSRIARELHAVVARSVTAMVVESEAAATLLGHDLNRADVVMAAIESTGRQALTDMRRILGVLRHPDETGEREPQPGVDQIYTLIQHARELGQPVALSVDGQPGTLAPGVELALYRIIEDVLTTARRQPDSSASVQVTFKEQELELRVTTRADSPTRWPTNAMRERAALCDGVLNASHDAAGSCELVARLPRTMQGVTA